MDSEFNQPVYMEKKGLAVGKDIGLISYNESPPCEMILERSLAKRHCDFRMTRRASF